MLDESLGARLRAGRGSWHRASRGSPTRRWIVPGGHQPGRFGSLMGGLVASLRTTGIGGGWRYDGLEA
jgi:hypothetical protein